MSIFKSIVSPMQNCDEISVRFCQKLEVMVTETSLKKEVTDHPDYPSLLSVSDALRSFKVQNMALKTTSDNFSSFPVPFMVQINGQTSGHTLFAIVNKVLPNNAIDWYNPEKKKDEQTSKADFDKIFTGYVMLAEADEESGEADFRKKKKEEMRRNFQNGAIALALPILLLLLSGYKMASEGISATLFPICYATITLLGTITGALLLLYEIDQHNPVLQTVCRGGHKTNCGAILNSKASHIWGISWSSIGFTYFCGTLLALMTTGLNAPEILSVLAFCNLAALPYIAFSLYYQGRIARQWCPMCLTVQAALALQFVTAFAGHFLQIPTSATISAIIPVAVCFGFVFLAVQLLMPSLQKSKEGKYARQELARLKHNPEVFNALLKKQKRISEPATGLGITLGNSEGKTKLIKVCNPYCGPCATAHPVIEDLLQNNPDLQVQIIFTASGRETDFRNSPVQHLLAIAEKGDETLTKQALDDWYMVDKKDYDQFALKYPMNGELKSQMGKILTMNHWNETERVAYTPTFFVNDYQLPEIYHVSDLKYFLSV
ncbi:MAG: thioredoxin protein [Bacteroidetes bacterium]|nr:thioredoxin protein [Bacteroidota bacterium]